MESIGQKLKTTREEKGYTIDQIARDTNIARRYITALEEEDFTAFPGEPYLIGFLRNYADYLGLKSDDLVQLYKNIKIQEEPVPMDELLSKKPLNPVAILAGALIVVAVGAASALIVWLSLTRKPSSEAAEKPDASSQAFALTEEIVERPFPAGQVIEVVKGGAGYTITLSEVGDDLKLAVPGGSISVRLGEERLLDFDGDGVNDLKVYVRDIDKKGQSAVLRFDKFVQPAAVSDQPLASTGAAAVPPENLSPVNVSTDIASRKVAPVTVMVSAQPQPFSMVVVFRGYCLVRYSVDGGTIEQRIFQKGDNFRVEVSRQARFAVSNAGSFKARIGTVDLELGRPGEITVKDFAWVKDDAAGNYKLTVSNIP